MKKNLFLVAAATLMLGLAACTDDPIVNPATPDIPESPIVKSTDDLKGTEWSYSLDLGSYEFEDGTLDLGFEFGLSFDENYAHLSFPDNVTVFSMTDEYTLEEIESMNFAYSYDMTTTSGTLVSSQMEIPFRYDETSDAILIDAQLVSEGIGDEETTFTIVFHRK